MFHLIKFIYQMRCYN